MNTVNSNRRRRYKRGYPVAVLVGFEKRRAVLWRIFSNVAKYDVTVELKGEEGRHLYDFRESIVNSLRPVLKEGVKSIVVATPAGTEYAKDFLDHIRKHHAWLARKDDPRAATFCEVAGSAGQLHEVHDLVKREEFRKALKETTSGDAGRIAGKLEERLSHIDKGTVVLYSLEDIERIVDPQWTHGNIRPEHLVLTNKYLADTKEKGRVQRILQISKNRGIKITVVDVDTQAGVRLSQLGGLVCFTGPK